MGILSCALPTLLLLMIPAGVALLSLPSLRALTPPPPPAALSSFLLLVTEALPLPRASRSLGTRCNA